MDERGLFCMLMPDISHVFKRVKCLGGKYSEDTVTVLIAANSDGSKKLPPVMVVKSAKP